MKQSMLIANPYEAIYKIGADMLTNLLNVRLAIDEWHLLPTIWPDDYQCGRRGMSPEHNTTVRELYNGMDRLARLLLQEAVRLNIARFRIVFIPLNTAVCVQADIGPGTPGKVRLASLQQQDPIRLDTVNFHIPLPVDELS